jgi:hypothetical protein
VIKACLPLFLSSTISHLHRTVHWSDEKSYEPFSKWRMGATTPLKVPMCNTLPIKGEPSSYNGTVDDQNSELCQVALSQVSLLVGQWRSTLPAADSLDGVSDSWQRSGACPHLISHAALILASPLHPMARSCHDSDHFLGPCLPGQCHLTAGTRGMPACQGQCKADGICQSPSEPVLQLLPDQRYSYSKS